MQHVQLDIWTECLCVFGVTTVDVDTKLILLPYLCDMEFVVCTPPALSQRYAMICDSELNRMCLMCLCIHSRFTISANQDKYCGVQ